MEITRGKLRLMEFGCLVGTFSLWQFCCCSRRCSSSTAMHDKWQCHVVPHRVCPEQQFHLYGSKRSVTNPKRMLLESLWLPVGSRPCGSKCAKCALLCTFIQWFIGFSYRSLLLIAIIVITIVAKCRNAWHFLV